MLASSLAVPREQHVSRTTRRDARGQLIVGGVSHARPPDLCVWRDTRSLRASRRLRAPDDFSRDQLSSCVVRGAATTLLHSAPK